MSGNAVAGGGKGDLSSSSDDDVPVQKKACIIKVIESRVRNGTIEWKYTNGGKPI
jgi:hypothetical protein